MRIPFVIHNFIIFQLEELPGERPNTFRYFFDGYVYHKDNRSKDPTYGIYRCSQRTKYNCPGALIADGELNVQEEELVDHYGHAQNNRLIAQYNWKINVLTLCRTTSRELREIFDQMYTE